MPHLESVNTLHNQKMIALGHTLAIFFLGMFTIFAPLYLYQSGVPILGVIFYELLFWSITSIVVIPLYKCIAAIGLRRSFFLAWPFRMLFFGVLAYLPTLVTLYPLWIVLPLLSIIHRLAAGFYWLPYHSLFAFSFDGQNEGEGLGKIEALSRIASILSPIIGAFFLTSLAGTWFFVIVACGYSIGLFLLSRAIPHSTLTFSIDTKKIYSHLFKRYTLQYFTEGVIDRVQAFVWPFLLGIRGMSLTAMGGLFTVTNLIRTILCLLIGKNIDRHQGWIRLIQGSGIAIMSISLFVRGVFTNFITAALGQSLGGIGQTLYALPTIANMYSKATPQNFSTAIAVREIMLSFGRITVSFLALMLTLLYQANFALQTILILSGVWCAMRSLHYFKKQSFKI